VTRGGPRFTLLGIGAALSPRYPPTGLLIAHRRRRVAIDGGAEPDDTIRRSAGSAGRTGHEAIAVADVTPSRRR
jgi:hypothetical protein